MGSKCLQNEYTLASKLYESDPCDANANLCHAAKEKLELFYEEKIIHHSSLFV